MLLNPVVGPEAVCGSSRMKGGSMTKILLDTVIGVAVQRVFGNGTNGTDTTDTTDTTTTTSTTTTTTTTTTRGEILKVLSRFEAAYRATYLSGESIAAVMDLCGKSLSATGDGGGDRGGDGGDGGDGGGDDGDGGDGGGDTCGAQSVQSVQQGSSGSSTKGHVYFVGCGTAGIMASIDASEMPDTYVTPPGIGNDRLTHDTINDRLISTVSLGPTID